MKTEQEISERMKLEAMGMIAVKNQKLTLIAILLSVSVFLASGSLAQTVTFKPVYGEIKPVCACEALAKVIIPNTTIQSAGVDPQDGSCRVTAAVNHPPASDSVKVWIVLPTKNWNGRFQGRGGGGFSGGDSKSLAEPLSQGFAAGATDTGHEGRSGSFALDGNRLDWQLIRDNAYLGIHDMTVVGKALVESYFGKPARYSYFVGGSTGGRQGLSEAQRFPEDYDGVLSLWPAINWPRFVIAELWPQVVMNELHDYLSAEKFRAANKILIETFDGKDGAVDGVIDDPIHNHFDPKGLVGKKFGDSEFTEQDAAVIRKIWEGPRTHDGKFLWYGLLPGADLTALGGTKGDPLAGNPFFISADYVRYFLLSDPKWTGVPLGQNEFELIWNQSVEQYGEVFGTDTPDLARFRDHGGKIIIVHGLVDQLIFPQGSIDYYERVQARMGGAKKTAEFARLFLVPGIDHGNAGPGPKPANQLELLVRWVEEKTAPDQIKAELKDASGKVIQSRFYFPYDRTAKIPASGAKKVP